MFGACSQAWDSLVQKPLEAAGAKGGTGGGALAVGARQRLMALLHTIMIRWGRGPEPSLLLVWVL